MEESSLTLTKENLSLQRQLEDSTIKTGQLEVELIRLRERNRQLEALLNKHGIKVPEEPTAVNANSHGTEKRRSFHSMSSEDETDLGAKEAADAIIATFAKPSTQTPDRSPTRKTSVANGVKSPTVESSPHINGTKQSPEAAEAKDRRGLVGSSLSPPSTNVLAPSPSSSGNTAKLQLHMQYVVHEEQLSIEVLQGEQLALLGVLDFSKVYFKMDLIPGRLISARTGNVLFSPNTPLNASASLQVRQTSLRWKKLQLQVWSVPDIGSEACMGSAQVDLQTLHKDQAEATPWVNVVADESGKKEDIKKERAISSSALPRQTELNQQQPAATRKPFSRRHTLSGPEEFGHRTTTPEKPAATASSPSSSPNSRMFQKRRMAAAVMQAARSEGSGRERKTGTADGAGSSFRGGLSPTEERKTSWSKPSTPKAEAANGTTSTSSTLTPSGGMTAAVDDDNIPDIRSMNRSRTGGQSLPSSPFKKAVVATAFQSPFSSTHHSRLPSLSQVGRAVSADNILIKQRRSSSSGSDDLKSVVTQDKIAKEVLTEEIGKDEQDSEKPAANGDDGDGSQVLERLHQLRNSQRKKPEGLSFRQKQAFFVTASVDLPDKEKPAKK